MSHEPAAARVGECCRGAAKGLTFDRSLSRSVGFTTFWMYAARSTASSLCFRMKGCVRSWRAAVEGGGKGRMGRSKELAGEGIRGRGWMKPR